MAARMEFRERGGLFHKCRTNRSFLLLWLFCLEIKSGFAQLDLFFVFGDSYAATGNSSPRSPCWSPPYGISWPGYPQGRFSNGLVKTDVLAMSVFGVQSPPPYNMLSASGGINFAVAGSGVTQALGIPPLDEQVRWFANYVEVGLFGLDMLKNAVVFVSVSGNDYGAYHGRSLQGYLSFVPQIVGLIEQNLRWLYQLGIRNFMVSSAAPISCLPARTIYTGFTSCPANTTVDLVTSAHNNQLGSAIESLSNTLEGSNFIYLQQTKAFSYILQNATAYGLTEALRPCCTGACGVSDFQTCADPDKHLFWDSFHPTQAGWKAIVDLYYNHTGFTLFSPSLKEWVQNLGTGNY